MSENKAIRTYEPIWIQLKKQGKVSISAPKALQRRIIKAVLKEKYMDAGYKYLLQEKFMKAKIKYKKENAIVTFTLTETKDNYAL